MGSNINGETVKPYLDYLDKEMTIMGILSTFCVGVAGLVAKQAMSLGTAGKLLELGRPDISSIAWGLLLLIIAAGFFYKQRSLLAWHYGQLSLWATDAATSGRTLASLLQESDTWSGWIPYQVGLIMTAGGFCELARIFVSVDRQWEMGSVIAIGTFVTAGICAIVRVCRDKALKDSGPQSRRRLRAD